MNNTWRPHPKGAHKHYLVLDEENNRYICLLCGRAFSKSEAPQDATFYTIEI